MIVLQTIAVAFAMFSAIPVPQFEWNEKNMRYAMCAFPLIGVVIGAAWCVCGTLPLPGLAKAAGFALIPVWITGGIHLDGFCDTCDALSSHQSRERKLEILKDSHTGAFAIICCGLYLLVFFAAWCEAAPAGGAALALALGPAFSRSLSGLFAVTLPNARGTGLLATFTGPMDAVKARGVLAAWAVLTGGAMVAADVRTGLAALAGAGLACVYYVVTARRQFGGVTGDLAGFFLQLCELGMVLCAAVGQRLEVLL